MKAALIFIAATFVCAVVTVSWLMIDKNNDPRPEQTTGVPLDDPMPSIGDATVWLNSDPLTDAHLRGKVVLVNFWTYSCINWRRQLPYVRAWAEKYKSDGLVVVGVHTPEFPFEKEIDNVRNAAEEMDIDYPIALDNDYAIWSDFENRYWPALYFVDVRGNIRHRQFGEGNYEASERIIQKLLAEKGTDRTQEQLVAIQPGGAEAPADWNELASPEVYAGYDRTQNFASPGGVRINEAYLYGFPSNLEVNRWALSGTWRIGREVATLHNGVGAVRHRFHARDLHLVMGPSVKGAGIRFRVLIDGTPPGSSHGVDVDENGYGTVTEPRMYQLIRQTTPISDRLFEIEFFEPGAELYSFTFG